MDFALADFTGQRLKAAPVFTSAPQAPCECSRAFISSPTFISICLHLRSRFSHSDKPMRCLAVVLNRTSPTTDGIERFFTRMVAVWIQRVEPAARVSLLVIDLKELFVYCGYE